MSNFVSLYLKRVEISEFKQIEQENIYFVGSATKKSHAVRTLLIHCYCPGIYSMYIYVIIDTPSNIAYLKHLPSTEYKNKTTA